MSWLTPFENAIASIESSGQPNGGYGAIGPTTDSGDNAYGKYQVMGNNIPSWTKSALGYSLTPDQFLARPSAQDATFDNQFGGYLKNNSPQDAASMWFTGKPLAQGANASDVTGTTGTSYVGKFMSFLGGGSTSTSSADPSSNTSTIGSIFNFLAAPLIGAATGATPPPLSKTFGVDINHYFIRTAVVIVGFIFIAMGLSMFKSTQPIINVAKTTAKVVV